MRKFNLEEAKNGAEVCTRNGDQVSIILTDVHNIRPISALVSYKNGSQDVINYFSDGRTQIDCICLADLVMRTVKKSGWINIYSCGETGNIIYPSKDEAIKSSDSELVVDTIKIEWEE